MNPFSGEYERLINNYHPHWNRQVEALNAEQLDEPGGITTLPGISDNDHSSQAAEAGSFVGKSSKG